MPPQAPESQPTQRAPDLFRDSTDEAPRSGRKGAYRKLFKLGEGGDG